MGPQVFPNRRLVCRIPPFPPFLCFPFPFPREMPFCFSDPTEITSPQDPSPRQAPIEGAHLSRPQDRIWSGLRATFFFSSFSDLSRFIWLILFCQAAFAIQSPTPPHDLRARAQDKQRFTVAQRHSILAE
jgi:hypothetical protein